MRRGVCGIGWMRQKLKMEAKRSRDIDNESLGRRQRELETEVMIARDGNEDLGMETMISGWTSETNELRPYDLEMNLSNERATE